MAISKRAKLDGYALRFDPDTHATPNNYRQFLGGRMAARFTAKMIAGRRDVRRFAGISTAVENVTQKSIGTAFGGSSYGKRVNSAGRAAFNFLFR